jgi:methanethiol S-methyltransferase
MQNNSLRIFFFIYGLVAYIFFGATFIYLIGFVGSILVPKTIDSLDYSQAASNVSAILIDTFMLSLFGLQHSVMARPKFKEWWTKIIPTAIERSTYVLMTSAVLCLVFWQWRSIEGMIWNVENILAKYLLNGLFVFGWLIVLLSTFLINHFDLFGLRQVYLNLRSVEYQNLEFKTVGIYQYVRHPLMLGFLIAFWATPQMSASHLLFAVVMTIYISIGVYLEERDLIAIHGEAYRQYQQEVSSLVPLPKKN